ncbi:MAG: FAD-dependent oxidoreductase [Betaproteobacteria bacterium]
MSTSIRALGAAPAGTPMAVSLKSTRELATGSWRTFRPARVTRPSPCMLDCPAGTDVRAVLAAAAAGDVETAWRTIRHANPFPGICGRVCYHPCELACNREALDGAVAIHAVERAIADEAYTRRLLVEAQGIPQMLRVGVVGAGPAGLSCAYHLARRGYPVTVFDEQPRPGGMLRYGIPAYRLPRPVLDAELDLLAQLGITFVGGVRVGAAPGAPDLSAFAALFIAIGAQRSSHTHIAGDTVTGVEPGLALLRSVNAGVQHSLSGPVVVIGGGNTAIDTARVALRLGAEPTVVYRRGREQMPAHPDEVAQAEREGVRFLFWAAPIRFLSRRGRLDRVEFQRMRPGAPDSSGRAQPEPIAGATTTMPAVRAFTAIGEEVEVETMHGLAAAMHGRLRADDWGRTRHRSVFAGGDAATGAGTVADAIGSGRRAALAIDAHLLGRDVVGEHLAERVGGDAVNLFYFPRQPRVEIPMQAGPVHGFGEAVGGIGWEAAAAEARRCFVCGECTACDNCYVFCPDAAVVPDRATGEYAIDLTHCKGCGICVAECPRGAMTWDRESQSDGGGAR